METGKPTKTTLGLNENIEALLCYLVIWFSGLIFIFVEKENKFVRFHAIQSLVAFLPLFIAYYILRAIPLIGGFLSFIAGVLEFVLWIFMMYKAYKGEKFKLPFAGDFAEQQVDK
jgi:uncharacterized membrane protein